MRHASLWSSIGAMLFALVTPAVAQDSPADDLLHADLPLFGSGTTDMWPQHIGGPDIGCDSRVAFGVWQMKTADNYYDDTWYGIHNQGLFHCAALLSTSDEQKSLKGATPRSSFFILLERSGDSELWAVQIGARPGSDYLLLRRTPDKGIIQRFDVLQRECPAGLRRDGGNLEILLTRYCALRSRDDLLTLARAMAKRPPLGTLTLVAQDK